MSQVKHLPVSIPTLRRLPLYLRVLNELLDRSEHYVSSTYIADRFHLEPIQVRKDLAAFGITGQPRLGFIIKDLRDAIIGFLGWNNIANAFIIGAGNLGSALAGYPGFADYGLNIVAAFDIDRQKTGRKIHGKKILHIDSLPDFVISMKAYIAVLTLPGTVAQGVTDRIVDAGIRAIWNFTPVNLTVPEDIIVEKVDFAASLAVLSRSIKERDHRFSDKGKQG